MLRTRFGPDITFIWTGDGWMYMAVILDDYKRQIVRRSTGDALSHRILPQALD